MKDGSATTTRRTGDTVAIGGDYQYRALTRGGGAPSASGTTPSAGSSRRYLDPRPTDRILDVGCGSGVVAAAMADAPVRECVGIDGSADAVAFASRQFRRPNLRFERCLVDELDLPEGYFDACGLHGTARAHPPRPGPNLARLSVSPAPPARRAAADHDAELPQRVAAAWSGRWIARARSPTWRATSTSPSTTIAACAASGRRRAGTRSASTPAAPSPRGPPWRAGGWPR